MKVLGFCVWFAIFSLPVLAFPPESGGASPESLAQKVVWSLIDLVRTESARRPEIFESLKSFPPIPVMETAGWKSVWERENRLLLQKRFRQAQSALSAESTLRNKIDGDEVPTDFFSLGGGGYSQYRMVKLPPREKETWLFYLARQFKFHRQLVRAQPDVRKLISNSSALGVGRTIIWDYIVGYEQANRDSSKAVRDMLFAEVAHRFPEEYNLMYTIAQDVDALRNQRLAESHQAQLLVRLEPWGEVADQILQSDTPFTARTLRDTLTSLRVRSSLLIRDDDSQNFPRLTALLEGQKRNMSCSSFAVCAASVAVTFKCILDIIQTFKNW